MRTPFSQEDKKRPVFSSEEERKGKKRRKIDSATADDETTLSAVYQQIIQESQAFQIKKHGGKQRECGRKNSVKLVCTTSVPGQEGSREPKKKSKGAAQIIQEDEWHRIQRRETYENRTSPKDLKFLKEETRNL